MVASLQGFSVHHVHVSRPKMISHQRKPIDSIADRVIGRKRGREAEFHGIIDKVKKQRNDFQEFLDEEYLQLLVSDKALFVADLICHHPKLALKFEEKMMFTLTGEELIRGFDYSRKIAVASEVEIISCYLDFFESSICPSTEEMECIHHMIDTSSPETILQVIKNRTFPNLELPKTVDFKVDKNIAIIFLVFSSLFKEIPYSSRFNSIETWKQDFHENVIHLLSYVFIAPEKYHELNYIVDLLSREQVLMLFSTMMHQSEILSAFWRQNCVLESLDIEDGGYGANTWERVARIFLKKLVCPLPKTALSEAFRDVLRKAETRSPMEESASWLENLEKEGWDFIRWQGRTRLYRHRDTGEYLAVKWQKEEESLEELIREWVVLEFVQEHYQQLGLISEYPAPLGVCTFQGKLSSESYTSDTVITHAAASKKHPRNAFVYRYPNSSYFSYLHDENLSDEEVHRGRVAAMHDVGVFAAKLGWVLTSLSDIFHNIEFGHENRLDGGRYLPLTGLIRSNLQGIGGGRVTGWEEAIRNEDRRASGVADVGDGEFLENIDDPDYPLSKASFSQVFEGIDADDRPLSRVSLLANFFGEYLLTDELSLGFREKKLQRLSEKDNLARKISVGPAALLQGYTGWSSRISERIVRESGTDWNLYANQMAFWMDNTQTGYLPHIKKQMVPKDVYHEDVLVTVCHPKTLRGWSKSFGFSIDQSQPDLGNMNGPNPIKEGDSARHLRVLELMLGRESRLLAERLTLEAVKLSDCEAISLLKRALLLDPYSLDVHFSLSQRYRSLGEENLADAHQRQWAALRIQRAFTLAV